jgi:hypothetical protein
MDDLSEFDAWPVFEKARKPIGLAKWNRLEHMADKLEGKQSSDITFTTCYPGQEGKKKLLGSVEGNLHCLLGYISPSFHWASYHYAVMDPNLSDEEIEELYKIKGHPARPELWKKAGMKLAEPEGDLADGKPHASVADVQKVEVLKKQQKANSIKVKSGAGSYVAMPAVGLVYGEHNDHVYKWEMIQDSFMAAAHPDMTQTMNIALQERIDREVEVGKNVQVPELVKHYCIDEDVFADEVYPLVKSLFPLPGSVIPVELATGETVYGVVKSKSIDFYNRNGYEVKFNIYDREYTSFDLTKGGNIYSSILYNFGIEYLGLDKGTLDQFVKEDKVIEETPLLKGEPTPGFDNVEPELNEGLVRNVIMTDDNTFRSVIEAP